MIVAAAILIPPALGLLLPIVVVPARLVAVTTAAIFPPIILRRLIITPVALLPWFFVPPRLLVAIIIMPVVLTAVIVMLRPTFVLHIIVPITRLPLLRNLRFKDWLWATTVHEVVAQFAVMVALSSIVAASPVSLRTLLLLLLVTLDLARLAENLVSGGDPLIDGVE